MCGAFATIQEQGCFIQLSPEANEPFRHFKLDAGGSESTLFPAPLCRLYTRLQAGDFGLQRIHEHSRLRNLAGPHQRLTAYVGVNADRAVDHALYIAECVTSSLFSRGFW